MKWLDKFNSLRSMTGKRGQSLGGVIAIIVLVIAIVAVAIPITLDVISDANVTGTTATLLALVPVLLGLLLIVGIFRAMGSV